LREIFVYFGMNVATGRKLKQLLAIVAESVPFKGVDGRVVAIAENGQQNTDNQQPTTKMLDIIKNLPDICLYFMIWGCLVYWLRKKKHKLTTVLIVLGVLVFLVSATSYIPK